MSHHHSYTSDAVGVLSGAIGFGISAIAKLELHLLQINILENPHVVAISCAVLGWGATRLLNWIFPQKEKQKKEIEGTHAPFRADRRNGK